MRQNELQRYTLPPIAHRSGVVRGFAGDTDNGQNGGGGSESRQQESEGHDKLGHFDSATAQGNHLSPGQLDCHIMSVLLQRLELMALRKQDESKDWLQELS